jgi:hypothetical protein
MTPEVFEEVTKMMRVEIKISHERDLKLKIVMAVAYGNWANARAYLDELDPPKVEKAEPEEEAAAA